MIDIADVIDIASDRDLHGAELDVKVELNVYEDGDFHVVVTYRLKDRCISMTFNVAQLNTSYIDWQVIIGDACDNMLAELVECVL